MDASFGLKSRPASMLWADIRKGPPRRAVLDHLERVTRYRHHMQQG